MKVIKKYSDITITEEELKMIVKQLNADEYVEFLGQKDHESIIPLLSKSKALIINTEKDNSMLSIVEAIACGTPILTTNVPYNCSYIKKEKLGVICDDVVDLKSLKEIDNNNSMYVNNCLLYRDKISNSYHVNQFINEYKKVGDNCEKK